LPLARYYSIVTTRYVWKDTSPVTTLSSLISATYIPPSRPVSSLESVHWQAWSFSTTSHSASVTHDIDITTISYPLFLYHVHIFIGSKYAVSRWHWGRNV